MMGSVGQFHTDVHRGGYYFNNSWKNITKRRNFAATVVFYFI